MQNTIKNTPEGFCIVDLKSWPSFFASFCYIPTIYILQRYQLQISPAVEKSSLSDEVANHFRQDSQPSTSEDDVWIWLQSFLGSNKYKPNLFLETLYFGLFWADFTMQTCYARTAYEPTRDNCIRVLDYFLEGALGFDSKKINEINMTLVERGMAYGIKPIESIFKFAEFVNGLTSNPLQYAGRANLYFSHAHESTLRRSFINVSENNNEVKIHCLECKSPMINEIKRIPVKIQCALCARDYEITGFWGSATKEGPNHISYKVPIFRTT